MNSKLKIIFLGTPDFAVPSLQALIADRHFEVCAVFTQPDRAAGRGQHLAPPPVKVAAEQASIPVYQPAKLGSADIEKMREIAPDFLVVVAYGQLLPQQILDLPKIAPVNVHGSLLPRHRGASPVQAAILAGDAQTGISWMQMDTGLDTGPVFARESIILTGQERADGLAAELAKIGGRGLPDILKKIAAGALRAEPQDESLVTTCRKISKQDGQIDWQADTADLLVKKLRAYSPWPGLFTFIGKKRLKILNLKIAEFKIEKESGQIWQQEDRVCVAAAGGTAIELKSVQPEGKSAMPAVDWLRGDATILGSKLS